MLASCTHCSALAVIVGFLRVYVIYVHVVRRIHGDQDGQSAMDLAKTPTTLGLIKAAGGEYY
jgi:hypothetical protein